MGNGSMFDIFLIIGINLIFFARTLRYGYAVDDWENARCGCKAPEIVPAKTVRHGKEMDIGVCKKCGVLERVNPKNLWQKFLWSFGGLVWITDKNGDKNTTTQYTDSVFDHSLTLGLHIINCILIYLAFGRSDVSLLTAVLFAINPTAMQGSSVWLSGKGYSAGLMFSLLAYWLAPLAPIFYLIGSWYVSVLVLPAVFLHSPYWYWIFLLPIGFLYRKRKLNKAIAFKYEMVKKTRDPFHWHNILLVFKTIGYYFAQSLFPTRLGVHHEYLAMYGVTPQETKECLSLKDRFFWLGIAIAAATIYLFFWNWGPAAFGLLWYLVFIAPWSNWMAAVNQPIGERYCIIALVGVMYAAANILIGFPALFAALLAYYAAISSQFFKAYTHILNYAVYNVLNFPRSFQGWLWRSDIERNFKLYERSYDSAMQAWILRPDDFLVNNNITMLLLVQRKFQEAEQFLRRMAKAPMANAEMEKKRDDKVAAVRAQIENDKRMLREALREKMSPRGRNTPCICGSGKKYKNCCGK